MDIVSWVTNAISLMVTQNLKNQFLVEIKASPVDVEEIDEVVDQEASKTKNFRWIDNKCHIKEASKTIILQLIKLWLNNHNLNREI